MDLAKIPVVKARNGAQGPVSQSTAEIIVMHSMESPADDRHVTNWVQSLQSPGGIDFFGHYYCGPTVTYQVAPLGRVVWHCGNGNEVRGRWTLGVEEAGYAAFSRQDWIDCGVLHQSGPLVAALIAAGHGANRWLEIADLATPGIRGVTSHNNMSHAFGGSDHTDPGPNYPHDLLLGAQPAPTPPIPTPPIPAPQEDTMIFITNQAGQNWWLYDGWRKRPLGAGENQLLVDLGIVKPGPDGKPTVKQLSDAQVNAIPDAH